jgi:alcohol dehydrogenase class IV
VVTDKKENAKKVVNSLCSPKHSDCGPSSHLTLTMPPIATAETGMDAFVHTIECYVSMNATPEHFSQKPDSMDRSIPFHRLNKGTNLEARYFMFLAATMVEIAFASGGLGAAQLSVEAVEELLEPLHIPFHLRACKIPREGIPKLAEGEMKFQRLFVTNPRDVNEGDVRSLYEEAY